MKEGRQTVFVFDPETSITRTERRRRRGTKRRGGRRSYTFSERSSEVNQWWEENDMPTLVLQYAMAWCAERSELQDEMIGRGSQLSSAAMEVANADTKLLDAFKNANFRPITLISIAEKLRQERERMQNTIGRVEGGWVPRFFDNLIDDVLAKAKPTVDDDTKSLLKARIRGQKFF